MVTNEHHLGLDMKWRLGADGQRRHLGLDMNSRCLGAGAQRGHFRLTIREFAVPPHSVLRHQNVVAAFLLPEGRRVNQWGPVQLRNRRLVDLALTTHVPARIVAGLQVVTTHT